MNPKIVLVVWEDATLLESEPWCYSSDHTYTAKLFTQVGFLLADLPQGIILSHAWSPDGVVATRDQIPRGMIRSMVELKVPTVRKKK